MEENLTMDDLKEELEASLSQPAEAAEEEIEDPKAAKLIRRLVEWFEETVGGAYGGCDCRDILEDDPSNKIRRCPQVVESVFVKCMELLQENGILG